MFTSITLRQWYEEFPEELKVRFWRSMCSALWLRRETSQNSKEVHEDLHQIAYLYHLADHHFEDWVM